MIFLILYVKISCNNELLDLNITEEGDRRLILFSNDEIFRFNNSKCFGTVMHSHHYHDLFEIYYMASGKCNYFIDDKSYEVLEGDVVLIPEGVIHKTNYGGEEHGRILIECSLFLPAPSLQ